MNNRQTVFVYVLKVLFIGPYSIHFYMFMSVYCLKYPFWCFWWSLQRLMQEHQSQQIFSKLLAWSPSLLLQITDKCFSWTSIWRSRDMPGANAEGNVWSSVETDPKKSSACAVPVLRLPQVLLSVSTGALSIVPLSASPAQFSPWGEKERFNVSLLANLFCRHSGLADGSDFAFDFCLSLYMQ